MPLSFSNVTKKVKEAVPMALSTFNPLLGAAASALQNKQKQAATPLQPLAPIATAQAAAPAAAKPAVSNVNPSTLALQKQLNTQNANKQGWIPLKEDGVMGPKTQAAMSWQPVIASAYTPPSAQGQQSMNDQAGGTSATTAKTKAPESKEAPSFGGILFDLLQKASQGNEAVNQAREKLTNFRTATSDKIADIKSDDIPLEFQQGRAQVVQQASAEKEAALSTNVETALQQQQQELAAYQAAAGFAQPIQVPYSNQLLDPKTGLPVGGGAAGGSLQSTVADIATKLKNGTMGYDAGVSALQGYGQAGINALQQALGPNFNIQQSNAQAAAQEASTLQTGTIGGQLTKQADTVKEHMKTLDTLYSAMTKQSGIPAVNTVVNWFRQQTGSPAFTSYSIALQNVRDELAKILGGGTATEGSRATALGLLPENMTPQQLKAAMKTANELMDSKITEYTRNPAFSSNQAAGSGGLYDW